MSNNSLSFRVGSFIGAKPLAFLGLVLLLTTALGGAILASNSWAERKQTLINDKSIAAVERNRVEQESRRRAEASALAASCGTGFDLLAEKATTLVKAGNASDGLKVVAACADLPITSNAKNFIDATAKAAALEIAAKQKRWAAERIAAEKKVDLADKARRKRAGVSIGMTPEAVIASNWGKPRRVNRTIRENSVREQWVYDGSYLYFENGLLTTIQN